MQKTPASWIRETNIVKMPITPQTYTDPYQNSNDVFSDIKNQS
jgi:hypothetical protein